jgi:PKD repeat protein
MGTYCGTNSPGTVTATNTQGALTFVFHSDVSVTLSGWAANVSCAGIILPPVADFTADETSILEGGSVHFTDLSVNEPSSWSWTFEGGTPSTSSLENPEVVYNLQGVYDVTLTVTNEGGTNTMTKQDYITVYSLIGIKEVNASDISLFPNPAKDVVKIEAPEIIHTVSIVNILGSVELESSPNASSCNLDLSGFDAGFYFVRIQTGNVTATKKLQVKK